MCWWIQVFVCLCVYVCAQKATDADRREGEGEKPPVRGLIPSCEEPDASVSAQ